MKSRRAAIALFLASLSCIAAAQEIQNWSAPPFWQPPAGDSVAGQSRGERLRGALVATVSGATSPLPFVAITPCRIVDTRDAGQTGAFGPPALAADSTRNTPA